MYVLFALKEMLESSQQLFYFMVISDTLQALDLTLHKKNFFKWNVSFHGPTAAVLKSSSSFGGGVLPTSLTFMDSLSEKLNTCQTGKVVGDRINNNPLNDNDLDAFDSCSAGL